MTEAKFTPPVDAKARLDRLEELAGHLEHMLCEVFYLTDEIGSLCTGAANDTAQRAGVSVIIAQGMHKQIKQQIEALAGYKPAVPLC